MIPFGVFVQVADEIEGPVHLRELALIPVKTSADVVQVGDNITVVVNEIDRERCRLSISRRKNLIRRRVTPCVPATVPLPECS
ncbi:S1 RNA-binding domain-containing protein [Streptomyces sp. NPDC060085]|uniref:S1 RNA-binding domain-containing protein n=1 Tax=Streptomyces sp. NPDC060085 TaxID=3347054 RepID=UPI00364B6730